MPMWRCPHCGTPQPESARCWVCRRSSTSCATCRHFRRAVAAGLGYCALERGRRPLSGTEIRSCWDPVPTGAGAAVTPLAETTMEAADVLGTGARPVPTRTGVRNRRAFVPVPAAERMPPEGARPTSSDDPTERPANPVAVADPQEPEPRWSLFPELDP